jgi:hypothetical protein
MRILRRLTAAPLRLGRAIFAPSRPTPVRLRAQRQSGNCSRAAIRGATAWPTLGCAACLNACKDRGFPAGSMSLTMLGANVHGPRDLDNRMCAQR